MYRFPHVSPLALDAGLLSGWAIHPAHDAVQVELFIDDVKTEIATTGTTLPAHLHERVGTPASAQSGFVFPLPAAVFDGSAHTLCVKLLDPAAITDSSKRSTDAVAHLAESRLSFRHGPVSGRVMLDKGRLSGEVLFHDTPAQQPQLIIATADGQAIATVALTPRPSPPGSPARHAARFEHVLADEHDHVHLHCQGLELAGSPVSRLRKRIGLLEPVTQQLVHGWAMDVHQTRRVLELALVIDGHRVSRFRPNIRRDDIAAYMRRPLEEFGIIGFNFSTPASLLDGREHTVRIEFADDGTPLQGGQTVRFPAAYIDLDEFKARVAPRTPISTTTSATARSEQPHAGTPCSAARARHPRPDAPSLSIIVLNRNGASLLHALFDSFQRINTLPDVEWIIIDHASTDDSRSLIERWQHTLPIHLEALDYNDSFSASCNRGAGLARSDTLLFLNNDIVWLQDILPPLVDSLHRNPDVAALGVKLLKATDDANPLAQPEVQHLGIRFLLAGSAYWPYEITPAPERRESEYAPQDVPGVTGAVLLCRKADFVQAGQFRAEYFYGFEDVELCLRLQQRLGKRIICRNDLVALHRHGHSRLSGRQQDIFSRLLKNSDTLQVQVGLWLKFAYWRSLLAGDRLLTTDPLRIGIALADDPAQADAALALCARLQQTCPAAQLVMLLPDRGWFNLRDLHLLIIVDPRFDLRQRRYQRNDLLIAAWVRGKRADWLERPWQARYDWWLCDDSRQRKALSTHVGRPVYSTSADGLARLLDAQQQPLRIVILTPAHERRARHTEAARSRLAKSLQQAGALVWHEFDNASVERMVHVRIQVFAGRALTRLKTKAQPDCLDLLWALDYADQPTPRGPAGWMVTTTAPTLEQLRHHVESIVARTFHTP